MPGQSALLIAQPGQGSPFFRLAPSWAIYPLVVLATAATIIASQAIITGSFSLTRQAMQLGWFPGFKIRQTSDTEYGQDLRAGHQLADDGDDSRADGNVRQFRPARRRLRHGGIDDDDADDGAALQSDAPALEVADSAGRGGERRIPLCGLRILCGQSAEDRRWRLGTADLWRNHLHHHDDLARRDIGGAA